MALSSLLCLSTLSSQESGGLHKMPLNPSLPQGTPNPALSACSRQMNKVLDNLSVPLEGLRQPSAGQKWESACLLVFGVLEVNRQLVVSSGQKARALPSTAEG